jgi:hypothetical protein
MGTVGKIITTTSVSLSSRCSCIFGRFGSCGLDTGSCLSPYIFHVDLVAFSTGSIVLMLLLLLLLLLLSLLSLLSIVLALVSWPNFMIPLIYLSTAFPLFPAGNGRVRRHVSFLFTRKSLSRGFLQRHHGFLRSDHSTPPST